MKLRYGESLMHSLVIWFKTVTKPLTSLSIRSILVIKNTKQCKLLQKYDILIKLKQLASNQKKKTTYCYCLASSNSIHVCFL